MLTDETSKCWDCGKPQGVDISPALSPEPPAEPLTPTTPPPRSVELSGQAPSDTAQVRQTASSLQPGESGLERCEIVYENAGMSIRRFVAKVTGPNGAYEAGRSRNLTGEALFDILDDMAGEKYDGPSDLVQANVEILVELVAKLMKAGWVPTKEVGEHWWSKKFIRLVEANSTPTLVDSPKIWEPWFHSTSKRSFERKLAHQMGFDGKIRLFEVRTNDFALDALLNGRLFLDFYVDTKDGVFLRQIRSTEDWPQTTLIVLDSVRKKLEEVLRSDSSQLHWTIYSQTDSEFTLITERRPNLSKGYRIKHRGGISFELFTSQ